MRGFNNREEIMRATHVCESFGIVLSICGMTLLHAATLPPGTRETLAQFETGATRSTRCAGDLAVGTHKEISRFQILPSVWREYSREKNFQDPNAAWTVTERILRDREAEFYRATGRSWDATDLYLMWNAPDVSPCSCKRARALTSRKIERAFARDGKRRGTADDLDDRSFHAHTGSIHGNPARASHRRAGRRAIDARLAALSALQSRGARNVAG